MIIRLVIYVLCAVSSLACAPRFDLQTSRGANAVHAPRVGVVAGVRVTADTATWRGVPQMTSALAPLQVTIENDSPDRFRSDTRSLPC